MTALCIIFGGVGLSMLFIALFEGFLFLAVIAVMFFLLSIISMLVKIVIHKDKEIASLKQIINIGTNEEK